jgi:hypothetical protein
VLLSAALASAGCGGSEPTGGERTASAGSEASSAPEDFTAGIADLPYMPLRLEGTSIRFQRVYRLATLASESPLVPLPREPTQADVQAWAQRDLVPWVQLRSDIIADCRVEMRALRGGDENEHIVASALLGYLYEDTAMQLHGVRLPVPGNPRADVRAAPEERIEVLLEYARRAFERCLMAGTGDLEVVTYRQYCEQAITRLGPSSAEQLPDDGEREETYPAVNGEDGEVDAAEDGAP